MPALLKRSGNQSPTVPCFSRNPSIIKFVGLNVKDRPAGKGAIWPYEFDAKKLIPAFNNSNNILSLVLRSNLTLK